MKKSSRRNIKIIITPASKVNLNTSEAKRAYTYIEKENKQIIETPKVDEKKLFVSFSI